MLHHRACHCFAEAKRAGCSAHKRQKVHLNSLLVAAVLVEL